MRFNPSTEVAELGSPRWRQERRWDVPVESAQLEESKSSQADHKTGCSCSGCAVKQHLLVSAPLSGAGLRCAESRVRVPRISAEQHIGVSSKPMAQNKVVVFCRQVPF